MFMVEKITRLSNKSILPYGMYSKLPMLIIRIKNGNVKILNDQNRERDKRRYVINVVELVYQHVGDDDPKYELTATDNDSRYGIICDEDKSLYNMNITMSINDITMFSSISIVVTGNGNVTIDGFGDRTSPDIDINVNEGNIDIDVNYAMANNINVYTKKGDIKILYGYFNNYHHAITSNVKVLTESGNITFIVAHEFASTVTVPIGKLLSYNNSSVVISDNIEGRVVSHKTTGVTPSEMLISGSLSSHDGEVLVDLLFGRYVSRLSKWTKPEGVVFIP